jgi:hypothetical protein
MNSDERLLDPKTIDKYEVLNPFFPKNEYNSRLISNEGMAKLIGQFLELQERVKVLEDEGSSPKIYEVQFPANLGPDQIHSALKRYGELLGNADPDGVHVIVPVYSDGNGGLKRVRLERELEEYCLTEEQVNTLRKALWLYVFEDDTPLVRRDITETVLRITKRDLPVIFSRDDSGHLMVSQGEWSYVFKEREREREDA